MRISGRLNLVIPVEGDAGTFYVHAAPISREVFERYFLVISKAFAEIYTQELNVVSGPRVAALVLRMTAENLGLWDGPNGIKAGLMNEIRRLANVITLGPAGWTTQPLETAIQTKVLDADDVSEVEGAIVFFILASAVHTRNQIADILGGLNRLWDTQTTLSNCTDYAASLPTLTAGAASTATTDQVPTAAALSVPT